MSTGQQVNICSDQVPESPPAAVVTAKEKLVGEVVTMPRRRLSRHPEAVRSRQRRAAAKKIAEESAETSAATGPETVQQTSLAAAEATDQTAGQPAGPATAASTAKPASRATGRPARKPTSAASAPTEVKPGHSTPAAGRQPDREEHPLVLTLLFVLCAMAAAGTFFMARDTLAGMFPGLGADVRALGLVGCELAFGHGAYSLIRSGRIWLGVMCVMIVLLCAAAEIGLASTQGELATRARQDMLLTQSAPAGIQTDPAAPDVLPSQTDGPQKTREILLAAADARRESQARQEKQRAAWEKRQEERLKLVTQRTPAERWLPALMALLCSLAAAATTPLLELLILSLRRRRRVAAP